MVFAGRRWTCFSTVSCNADRFYWYLFLFTFQYNLQHQTISILNNCPYSVQLFEQSNAEYCQTVDLNSDNERSDDGC